jgi:hypothetical protein
LWLRRVLAGATAFWRYLNLPETCYVALQDSAGKIKAISNPALSVMVTGHGEGWSTPLSQFTGINLSNVRKLIVGIGDRNAPKTGGKGKLNIDDVRLTRVAP